MELQRAAVTQKSGRDNKVSTHHNSSEESSDEESEDGVCCVCGEDFPFLYKLTEHFNTHKNEVCCHLCEKKFSRTVSLALHLKYAHPDHSLLCATCRVPFRCTWQLNAHLEKHKQEVRVKQEEELENIKPFIKTEDTGDVSKETIISSGNFPNSSGSLESLILHDHSYCEVQSCSGANTTNQVSCFPLDSIMSSQNVIKVVIKEEQNDTLSPSCSSSPSEPPFEVEYEIQEDGTTEPAEKDDDSLPHGEEEYSPIKDLSSDSQSSTGSSTDNDDDDDDECTDATEKDDDSLPSGDTEYSPDEVLSSDSQSSTSSNAESYSHHRKTRRKERESKRKTSAKLTSLHTEAMNAPQTLVGPSCPPSVSVAHPSVPLCSPSMGRPSLPNQTRMTLRIPTPFNPSLQVQNKVFLSFSPAVNLSAPVLVSVNSNKLMSTPRQTPAPLVRPLQVPVNVRPPQVPGEGSQFKIPGNVRPLQIQGKVIPLQLPGTVRPLQVPGNVRQPQLPGTVRPLQVPGNVRQPQLPGTVRPLQVPLNVRPIQVPGNVRTLLLPGNVTPLQVPGNITPLLLPGNIRPLQVAGNVAPPQVPRNAPVTSVSLPTLVSALLQNNQRQVSPHTSTAPVQVPTPGPLTIVAMCENRNRNLALPKQHQQTWRSKAIFACRHCGAISRQPALRVRHRYLHRGSRLYRCQCGRSFQRQLHLLRHQVQHAESVRFVCACCGNTFEGAHKLTWHKQGLQQKHRSMNSKHYAKTKCTAAFDCTCGQMFARPSALLWHILKNTKPLKHTHKTTVD